MDFSRWITFCMGLVAMMVVAFGTPCLCKTAQAAQPSGEKSPCCPTQQQDESEDSSCGCGCSEVGGDERTASVSAKAPAMQVEHDDFVDDVDPLDPAVKALLFAWFAEFVGDVAVEEVRANGPPPIHYFSNQPDYLELQVLRL